MNNLHQKLTSKYPRYHLWHQTKHHNKIHWGVFTLFSFFIFSLILNPLELNLSDNNQSSNILQIKKAKAGTSMGDLAASMQPGTWAELNTVGLTKDFIETDRTINPQGPYPILQFADSATWDPTSRQVLFLGSPHLRPYKFIIYSEVTNSWRLGPLPFPENTMVHSYDHNTINPTTGIVYYRPYNTSNVHQYDIKADTWSLLSSSAPYGNNFCCGGLEYFPEMNGLVLVLHGNVSFFDLTTKQWRMLAEGLPLDSNSQFAEYNPVHKVMFFGGGSDPIGSADTLYKLDASGTVTKLKSGPSDFSIGFGVPVSLIAVDPVSGKYMVFGMNKVFYEYDITTDIWTLKNKYDSATGAWLFPNNLPPIFDLTKTNPIFDTIETAIPEYGVNLFVRAYEDCSDCQPKVFLYKHSAAPTPPTPRKGDCSSEIGLSGRTDIVFCEPWEDPNWWQNNGYVADGSKTVTRPVTPSQMVNTSFDSTNCISGSCLKVDMLKGQSGAVSIHWPLSAAGLQPEQLYIRYYIKLSSNFSPLLYSPSGEIVGGDGKFPGLADVRVDNSSTGEQQCGNGGNRSDGINCWSMRSLFRDCYGDWGNQCSAKPDAGIRFGNYMYFPLQEGWWGNHGLWDSHLYGNSLGDGGTCQTTPNNTYCGIGEGGILARERWYLVEEFVKMNTPGQADGVLRGWIDGVLSYDKTNMVYRLPGHDNLHVRTMWLVVHKGGDLPNGNGEDMNVWLDQMVLATDAQIGPLQGGLPPPPPDITPPSVPANLTATAVSSSQINLSWTASTDNVGVTGYKIYRNGSLLTTLYSQLTTYQDTGLTALTTYTYTVSAFDAAGNNSAQSTPISATTLPLPPQPTGSLAASYALNEGQGSIANDFSGNSNNGTLNGPTWNTSGKYQGSLSFDGINDYVSIPNSASLDISGANLSISLWSNITDTTTKDYVILGKPWTAGVMSSPYYQYGIEFAKTPKTADFFFGDTLGGMHKFSIPVPTGVWTHIAFTYNGTTIKGYVDGIEKLSVPESTSIQARGTDLLLGVDGNLSQAFQGLVDNVRFYSRALSPTEIQADMNTGINQTPLQYKQSDFNKDTKVDQQDFDILKQDFNRTDKPVSDLNQDGIVDSRDLGIMMGEWTR